MELMRHRHHAPQSRPAQPERADRVEDAEEADRHLGVTARQPERAGLGTVGIGAVTVIDPVERFGLDLRRAQTAPSGRSSPASERTA